MVLYFCVFFKIYIVICTPFANMKLGLHFPSKKYLWYFPYKSTCILFLLCTAYLSILFELCSHCHVIYLYLLIQPISSKLYILLLMSNGLLCYFESILQMAFSKIQSSFHQSLSRTFDTTFPVSFFILTFNSFVIYIPRFYYFSPFLIFFLSEMSSSSLSLSL